MSQQIAQQGNIFFPNNSSIVHPKLPNGVYTFQYDIKGNMFLEYVSEKFKVPGKLYLAKQDKLLISCVKNSWVNEERNLGVLFSGVKGQGKTLTAKQIANELQLPVVLISKNIPIDIDFVQFLSGFHQDLVIFVDEFEKLFQDDYDSDKNSMHSQKSFLSFTDGIFTKYRRFFLFTSNTAVSEYFMNRPSRVRFVRRYSSSIDEEVFNEILDDLVKDPAIRKDIEATVDKDNCTIDVLMQIIREVENQGVLYSEFARIFNFIPEKKSYIIEINHNGKVVETLTAEMSVPDGDPGDISWLTLPIDKKLCRITARCVTSDEYLDIYTYRLEPGCNFNAIMNTSKWDILNPTLVDSENTVVGERDVTIKFKGPYSVKVSSMVV